MKIRRKVLDLSQNGRTTLLNAQVSVPKLTAAEVKRYGRRLEDKAAEVKRYAYPSAVRYIRRKKCRFIDRRSRIDYIFALSMATSYAPCPQVPGTRHGLSSIVRIYPRRLRPRPSPPSICPFP